MQVREELQEHVRQSGFMLSDVIGLLIDAQDGASPAMDVMQFHAGMLIACRLHADCMPIACRLHADCRSFRK